MSAYGRFVAFLSQATNLVAGDTNGVADVFVKDRQSVDVVSTCGFDASMLGTGVVRMAGTITSDGPLIVVERSSCASSPTRLWTRGESAILTWLP